MPRFPGHSPAVAGIPGSVYTALAHRLATFAGETYPLHVGDTWLEPPAGCRMEDLETAAHPGLHRYAPPQQIPVYNKDWYNFYPTARPYHMGHHFILDVF